MYFWHLITRLGDVQITLPLALLSVFLHVPHPPARAWVLRWTALLGVAALVTLATKVAFIGWGLGSARLDFTGISGHAMFAAAVYPLVATTLAGHGGPARWRLAVAGGGAIALLVGLSRVILGVHSMSEIVTGWLAGGVCVVALARAAPGAVETRTAWVIPLAVFLVLLPASAPSLDTHAAVTRVALTLSGHEHPYTRRAMLRERTRAGAGL